jgi:hypothetical protein
MLAFEDYIRAAEPCGFIAATLAVSAQGITPTNL